MKRLMTVLTDGSGEAATTITSAEAGRALISVTSADGTEATRQVQFVGSVSARVELHAAPATVGVNLAGGASESSQIIAVVRDLANNPVKGARVDFSATDPSAGAGLSSAFALTDDTGLASVSFYPGTP